MLRVSDACKCMVSAAHLCGWCVSLHVAGRLVVVVVSMVVVMMMVTMILCEYADGRGATEGETHPSAQTSACRRWQLRFDLHTTRVRVLCVPMHTFTRHRR